MKIAIYGKSLEDSVIPYVQKLFDLLAQKRIEVLIFKGFYKEVSNKIKLSKLIFPFKSHKEIRNKVDYFFSLGGDGTLLDTLTLVRDANIPIVGINIGRLGFLANIGKEDIETAIEAIEKKSYVLDKRTLLQLNSNKPLFGAINYGLNDFTIHKKDTSAMITIHTYINDQYLNSYWGDGLIISTPTGATGYSLSCGGPIIMPDSENFIITPVAPHNLNVRPMVISDNSVISFEIEGRGDSFLCTLDSRYETIDSSYKLSVKKENFTISLVRLKGTNFLETLRNKLIWGQDRRN